MRRGADWGGVDEEQQRCTYAQETETGLLHGHIYLLIWGSREAFEKSFLLFRQRGLWRVQKRRSEPPFSQGHARSGGEGALRTRNLSLFFGKTSRFPHYRFKHLLLLYAYLY